jgi:3-mercaptopyruvate sulfurtransferase SseA
VALILRGRGIKRVRPLAGGFHGWRDLGYPMTTLTLTPATSGARNA